MSLASNEDLKVFFEISKVKPDFAIIRQAFDSGGANINAVVKSINVEGGVVYKTIYSFIQQNISKNKYNDIAYLTHGTPDFITQFENMKHNFYPILDILEDYNWDIMNGIQFELLPNGLKTNQQRAGLTLTGLSVFWLLQKYDLPRFVQFFEKLYFEKGYSANDTSVLDFNPIKPYICSLYPEDKANLILYLVMKGADWKHPACVHNFSNFNKYASHDNAAGTIATIQHALSKNYITGPEGKRLRAFLATVYGIEAPIVLEKAAAAYATERRVHSLSVGPPLYSKVGGRRKTRLIKKRKRRTLKH